MANNNLIKLVKSFGYAFQGFRTGFRTQLNFRIHCCAAVIAILLGFLLKIGRNDWLWLMLSISLVLFAELINTALETLVDLVSPEYNILAGRVKDVAAAAVTVLAANAFITGLLIFSDPLLRLFS